MPFFSRRFPARESVRIGFKLTGGNVGVSGKKVTLPHYMAMFFAPVQM